MGFACQPGNPNQGAVCQRKTYAKFLGRLRPCSFNYPAVSGQSSTHITPRTVAVSREVTGEIVASNRLPVIFERKRHAKCRLLNFISTSRNFIASHLSMVRRISRSLAFDLHFPTSDRVPPSSGHVLISPRSVEFFPPERLLSSIPSSASWKLRITISTVRRIFIRPNYFSYSPPFFFLSLFLSCNVPPRGSCMSSCRCTRHGERRVMINHAKSVRR